MHHSDKVLNELIDLQGDFRLIDTDFAKIIGISNNYYWTIKTKSYVSSFMLPIFEIAVPFLKKVRKKNPTLHFDKLRAEDTQTFRARKYKNLLELRQAFKDELNQQDETDMKFMGKKLKHMKKVLDQ